MTGPSLQKHEKDLKQLEEQIGELHGMIQRNQEESTIQVTKLSEQFSELTQQVQSTKDDVSLKFQSIISLLQNREPTASSSVGNKSGMPSTPLISTPVHHPFFTTSPATIFTTAQHTPMITSAPPTILHFGQNDLISGTGMVYAHTPKTPTTKPTNINPPQSPIKHTYPRSPVQPHYKYPKMDFPKV